MAELKTKPTQDSVAEYLNAIPDPARRQDCLAIAQIMQQATGAEPQMWGTSIVGYGTYHYKGASGREGDWFVAGFSPRKQNLTLYIMSGFDRHTELMSKLGKYKTGKGCLYIKRLSDVNLEVLTELLKASVRQMQQS